MSVQSHLFVLAYLPVTLAAWRLLDSRLNSRAARVFLLCAGVLFCGWGAPLALLVLPALLLLFDRQIEKHTHKNLLPDFTKLNHAVIRRRKGLACLFLLLFLPAMYAQSHTGVYYKLDEALPQDMASIVANNKLKDEFDMATSHFVLLRDDLPATDMNRMEGELKEVEGVTSVLSYHAMLGAGIPDFFIPEDVRDMLKHFGASVTSEGTTAQILPEPILHAQKIQIPGDISSAAYFIAAGLIVPGSEILVQNVGVNPTRDGILRVLKDMGADITLLNESRENGEPTADLLVRHSELHGTTVGGAVIPALIDELPVVAALACFAKGTTVIKDAQELRVKESDRIEVMVENLRAMGAQVTGTEDGMIIEGGPPLNGTIIDSRLDHRIAMTFAVTALASEGETLIKDADCVRISYPGFYKDLQQLMNN